MQMRMMDDFITPKDMRPKNARDVFSYVQTCDVIVRRKTQPLAQGGEGYK